MWFSNKVTRWILPSIAKDIQCQPTKEKSVAIDGGKNCGVATATVIEECQCVSECYRKSYYEKATKVNNGKEEVVNNLVYILIIVWHTKFISIHTWIAIHLGGS